MPIRLAVGVATLAAPLALLPATSGQAAPTLTIAQAQSQLSALQAREDIAVEQYDAGTIAVATARAQVAAVRSRVKVEDAKLSAMQAQVAAFAAAAYTSGGMTGVLGLLTAANPTAALNRTSGLDEIARLRTAQLTGLSAEQTVVRGLQGVAKDRAAAASLRQHQLATAKASVLSLIAQQQAVLSHLQANQRAALLAAERKQQAAARAAASRSYARRALTRVAVAAPAAPAATRSAPVHSAPTPTAPPSSGVAAIVLAAAYSQLGKPYVYGAAGPNAYDCSGLVMWSFAHAGIALPHSAAAQSQMGTHVPLSQVQPGDVIYFSDGGYVGHVGIAVGGGMMIDANHTGGWVGVRPIYGDAAGATRF